MTTPGGKDTPYSRSFSVKVADDPWDTQSTRSFYSTTTPLPKTPKRTAIPRGSEDFQAVLKEMYEEIERENLAKLKAERKLKCGPGGRSISRIPTRVSLQTPSESTTSLRQARPSVKVARKKRKPDKDQETRL